jgi:hypothetical protein
VSGSAAAPRIAARSSVTRGRRLALRALARAPAWTITALGGGALLIAAPASADLAAASYRSDLFARSGFGVWDNAWYGGHHLPAYSLLAPALGWLIGPRLVAALAMVAAAALFEALIAGRFERGAQRAAAAWFALGAAIALLAWRVAFDLGLALGLCSLVLAQRGRRAPALVLAVVCALASPVASGFLALAALAWWLARRRRLFPLWLAATALAPVALLALAFPEGGFQPFVASAFYPVLAGVMLIAVLIPAQGDPNAGLLRTGVLLYALALIGAYVLRTPAGGNVDRLGALAAGPLAACGIAGARATVGTAWRRRALLALAPFLLYWQANAPVTDFVAASGDPAVHASYYAPLLRELQLLGVGFDARPARIEVVPTVNHWEAVFVAARVSIARGWERQLDNRRNALFYSSRALDATRLRAWLQDEAVSLIALPDAPLDYSARSEARLLRNSLPPYLHEVWSSSHWRLFAVAGASALAEPPAKLVRLDGDSFTLATPVPGSFTVRVRFTPYWRVAGGVGCVQRAAGEWTRLDAPGPGSFRVVVDFSPARVLDDGRRCR